MQQLTSLFNESRHQEVISLYIDSGLSPDSDPSNAQIAAASYFALVSTKMLIIYY